MERCPFCLGQMISCDCPYRRFYPSFDPDKPFSGLPESVYRDGLPENEARKWAEILARHGRIRFTAWPILCALCGEKWPEMFMVPNDEWHRYVDPLHRDKILCRPCFTKLKKKIDLAVDEERNATA